MTRFYYTAELDQLYSTAVDTLWFNANDNTLVIDWDDNLYRFTGVTEQEALSVAAGTYGGNSGSVGRAAQQLKKDKGPGEFLGYYDELDWERVDVAQTTAVPKDLRTYNTYNPAAAEPTKEYSLRAVPQAESVNVTATKEFSLKTPEPLKVVEESRESTTLFFTLDGFEKVYEFEAESVDLDDALAELSAYVKRVGATGKVVKAVIEFE